MQKQKLTGIVKNFVGNFGFIERHDFGDDVFWHRRDCRGLVLRAGDAVAFDLMPSPKHPEKICATNIALI